MIKDESAMLLWQCRAFRFPLSALITLRVLETWLRELRT